MSDGEQRGDGGIVSRRSGRHAAPPGGPVASVGGIRGRLVAALAWLFERRLHLLVVTVSIAIVAVISGAVLIAFTGESPPDRQLATAVDSDRPTPTGPGIPSTYAPILPTPAPSSSTTPTNPGPQAEGEPADPATDAPVEQPAAPVPTEPARAGTTPAEPNQPADPGGPSAPEQTGAPEPTRTPEEPDATEDCEEHAPLLQLILGPRCR